jgi:hypothetical protein
VEAFAIFCGMGINNVKMYETAVLAMAKQQVLYTPFFLLKETVPRDFRLQVFFMDQFPQAPEHTIRAVSNFSTIRGDIHKSRCTTGINNTSGKFATGISNNGGKFCHQ